MRLSSWVLAGLLAILPGFAGAAGAHAAMAADRSASTAADQGAGQASAAQLERVGATFEQRFPGLEVTQVRKAPVAGLFEVQVGMGLVYVDEPVDYVLQGSLIDANTRVDLTAARLDKLSEVPFDSLPVEHAIKIVRGDGSRKLAVFEDPNCIDCKQLHASVRQLDDITLYSFQCPILSPDSRVKSRTIWCASDPAAALQAWMVDGKTPATAECDDFPVEQVLALGQKLMVRGTPAILFADGSRLNGTLPTEALRARLDELDQADNAPGQ